MFRQAISSATSNISHAAGSYANAWTHYAQGMATRYFVLAIAGLVFAAALTFVLLAAFWALLQWTGDWVEAAGIMAAILALIGFVIVLIAYNMEPEAPSVPQALRHPLGEFRAQMPSARDVHYRLEQATEEVGPAKVLITAAIVGFLAGAALRRGGFEQFRSNLQQLGSGIQQLRRL